MFEAFIGALLGAVFGVVLGAYLVVKSAKKAVNITRATVGFFEIYEN